MINEEELKLEIIKEHLPYEIDMLCWALSVKTNDDNVNNAVIECFCLHSRNLIELLYRKGPVKEDSYVRAEHFTKESCKFENVDVLMKGNGQERSYYKKLCSWSGHLSYSRVSRPSEKPKGEDLLHIAQSIQQDLELFCKNLKEEFRIPKLMQSISVLNKVIQQKCKRST